MFAIAPGVVGIGTVRNAKVPVVIELLDAEPTLDLEDWEHVVEGGLEVATGRLVIASPTDFFPDGRSSWSLSGTNVVSRPRVHFRGWLRG